MKISIITVFADLYKPFLQTSLVARAQEQNLVSIDISEFRSFVPPKERIDAPTFGHGAGMLIRPEVVEKAIASSEQKHGRAFRIFFSPHGKKLNQRELQKITAKIQQQGHVMLLPGRYEGMDARVEQEYADLVLSIGDFVLMGGDLPTMMFIEGMLRLVPGVVGKPESVVAESFSGPFVDYPEYTAPVIWHDKQVPEVLRSGNHAAIAAWREEQAIKRTILGHWDWLSANPLTEQEKNKVLKAIPPHYIALMHTDVLIGDNQGNKPGTTSVTSLDIHDIARSCRTYGVKGYFIVTPLVDQQKVARTLLDFWQDGAGMEYNKSRYEAVKSVDMVDDLQQVVKAIETKEGKKPLIVVTSAQATSHPNSISFHDQEQVWKENRPVLIILGTGKGLTPEFIKKADFALVPVEGLTDYNHLSVRSAAAVILDRWLGLNPLRPT